MSTPQRAMGQPHPHESAHAQVAGSAHYIDDLPEAKGTLHAAPILSPVAHGRLNSVDCTAALNMPGVRAVVRAQDIPGDPMLAAITHTAAWINLFNLLPVWQLDGSRGFAALTRAHRWIVVGAFAFSWWLSQDGIFVLLTLVAAFRAFESSAPEKRDHGVAVTFVFLIVALALLMQQSAAMAGRAV